LSAPRRAAGPGHGVRVVAAGVEARSGREALLAACIRFMQDYRPARPAIGELPAPTYP
jgi:hypothetical protein